MKKKIVWVAVIGLLATGLALGNVRLPALIGDNMVLQRNAKIVLWGWADPGEHVGIAFHGEKLKAKTDRAGRWSTFAGPFTAGGPFDLVVTGKNRLELHNVLIGDVWLASGQSNMEFPLKSEGDFGGVYNAEREIAGASFPQIRLLKVHRKIALRPAEDVEADPWTAVTPETVGSFSAVAYLFGRELHRRYGVPIGLIETNWGGTVAEAWVSEGSLKSFPEFRQSIESLKRVGEKSAGEEYDQYVKQKASRDGAKLNSDPNKPTVLFNGMINPLVQFRIKGIIWYQGEANAMANRSTQYRTLFPALIEDWRTHWGYEVPFLFVQLAGFGPNKPEPAEYPWADLREAQSMTLSLPHTGMATAIDIGDEKDIHPKDKQDVAHRLVLAAAKTVYGENLAYSGPVYQSMAAEGNRIRIKFSQLASGLLIKDKYGYVRGFEIAGSDGKFVWAQAVKDGDDIVVFNEAVRQPGAVRYDWSNTPDGNLYNTADLPAIPFRTDAPKH